MYLRYRFGGYPSNPSLAQQLQSAKKKLKHVEGAEARDRAKLRSIRRAADPTYLGYQGLQTYPGYGYGYGYGAYPYLRPRIVVRPASYLYTPTTFNTAYGYEDYDTPYTSYGPVAFRSSRRSKRTKRSKSKSRRRSRR